MPDVRQYRCMPALSQLLHRRERTSRLCTGCCTVDIDLARAHGEAGLGLPSHSATEIAGPPGTGKTSLLLSLTVDALRSGLNVWWLSCAWHPFPLERLRSHKNYDSSYDAMIQIQNLDTMEQLLVVEPPPGVEFVAVEHCDAFIPVLQQPFASSRAKRNIGIQAIVKKLNDWSSIRCVVATTTSVPRLEHPDDIYRKMLSVFDGTHLRHLLLYHDELGCATSLGGHFRVAEDGIYTAAQQNETKAMAPTAPVVPMVPMVHSPIDTSSLATKSSMASPSVASFPSSPSRKKARTSSLPSSPPATLSSNVNTNETDSNSLEMDIIPNSQLEYHDVPLDQ